MSTTIPFPSKRVGKKPEFYKGLLVSANVARDENNVPLFGKVDPVKVEQMQEECFCQICGHKIGPRTWKVFPGNFHLYKYQEAPCHIECARYAAQVCPLILSKKDTFGFSVCKTYHFVPFEAPLWLDQGCIPTYGNLSDMDVMRLSLAHSPTPVEKNGELVCANCGSNNLGRMNYDEFMKWSA